MRPTRTSDDSPREFAQLAERVRRYGFLSKIRPTELSGPFLDLVFPFRKVITIEGMRLSIDPASHLGRTLLMSGAYEPETCEIFRKHISPGDLVLDVGANEGFFSALAALLVGREGCVVAVEPQSRLQDVIEINLALNADCKTLIVHNALGERDGDTLEINLFPRSNTGASSLVRRPRFAKNTETVRTVSPLTLLSQSGRRRFDFVKVDVEGFEPEVVRSLPMQSVGTLLVDYHAAILAHRGLDPSETDDLVRRTHNPVLGSLAGGYVLYKPAA